MYTLEGHLNIHFFPRDVWLGCLAPRLPTRALFQLLQCNTHLHALFNKHKRVLTWREWHSYLQQNSVALVFPAFAGDVEYCRVFLEGRDVSRYAESACVAALLGQHMQVIDFFFQYKVLDTIIWFKRHIFAAFVTLKAPGFMDLIIALNMKRTKASYEETKKHIKLLFANTAMKFRRFTNHDGIMGFIFKIAYELHHFEMLRVLLTQCTFSDELLEHAAEYQTRHFNYAFGTDLAKRREMAAYIRSFKMSHKRPRIE